MVEMETGRGGGDKGVREEEGRGIGVRALGEGRRGGGGKGGVRGERGVGWWGGTLDEGLLGN